MTVTATTAGTTAATTPASTGASPTAATSGYGALNMGSFISLMTTEMKNQDPTQPVDETQMVAQMAQMSSLSGINDMDATLKGISTTLNSIEASQQAANTAAAALTERVQVITNITVLPLHRPALLATQLATLDVLAAGRLVVGVGVTMVSAISPARQSNRLYSKDSFVPISMTSSTESFQSKAISFSKLGVRTPGTGLFGLRATPKVVIAADRLLRYLLVPVMVPVVPRPAQKIDIRPPVCFHICGPVHFSCALGFASLSYCPGLNQPSFFAICFAR